MSCKVEVRGGRGKESTVVQGGNDTQCPVRGAEDQGAQMTLIIKSLNLIQSLAHSKKCWLVEHACLKSKTYSFLSGVSAFLPPYF